MTSIFSPGLVVWAGLTVPPALLILTAWIGYRRSRGAPASEAIDHSGTDAPISLADHRREPVFGRTTPERRAA